MGILINLLILVVIIMVAFYIIEKMGLDPGANQIARVIIGVIALIGLLQLFWHPLGGWCGFYP